MCGAQARGAGCRDRNVLRADSSWEMRPNHPAHSSCAQHRINGTPTYQKRAHSTTAQSGCGRDSLTASIQAARHEETHRYSGSSHVPSTKSSVLIIPSTFHCKAALVQRASLHAGQGLGLIPNQHARAIRSNHRGKAGGGECCGRDAIVWASLALIGIQKTSGSFRMNACRTAAGRSARYDAMCAAAAAHRKPFLDKQTNRESSEGRGGKGRRGEGSRAEGRRAEGSGGASDGITFPVQIHRPRQLGRLAHINSFERPELFHPRHKAAASNGRTNGRNPTKHGGAQGDRAMTRSPVGRTTDRARRQRRR
jgi:hypothetical protein